MSWCESQKKIERHNLFAISNVLFCQIAPSPLCKQCHNSNIKTNGDCLGSFPFREKASNADPYKKKTKLQMSTKNTTAFFYRDSVKGAIVFRISDQILFNTVDTTVDSQREANCL